MWKKLLKNKKAVRAVVVLTAAVAAAAGLAAPEGLVEQFSELAVAIAQTFAE